MKALNLDRLNSLACIASTVSSIGTTEARRVAGKLLELIETESSQDGSLASKGVTDVAGLREHFADANAKFATEAVHPDDTIIAKTRLEYLEEVEREIVRLATLIHLHDKSFAIGAKNATNELGNEIAAIIVKHNQA